MMAGSAAGGGPRFRLAPALAILAIACGSERRDAANTADSVPAAPPDSLVARTPGGTEIWFTLARPAEGSDGTRCVERGLEIRRGETRAPVPLLYTGSVPEIVNDTTLRARLWTHCRPGDSYLVDLRSGQPVRERP